MFKDDCRKQGMEITGGHRRKQMACEKKPNKNITGKPPDV